MLKKNNSNFIKKDISIIIKEKIGIPFTYSENVINDLIFVLKKSIKFEEITIKNFGSFKIIEKKKRFGRNPKTKKVHIITARKSLSFNVSKKIHEKIQNI